MSNFRETLPKRQVKGYSINQNLNDSVHEVQSPIQKTPVRNRRIIKKHFRGGSMDHITTDAIKNVKSNSF